MISVGCGASSTEEVDPNETGAVENPDGGEPVLKEEGP